MTARRRRTLMHPDARRQQLLDAATWVFARKGYRHAGISDIIARAGVARGTFYLYFKSKQEVFLAIVNDFHSRITGALAQADDPVAVAAQAGTPQAVLRTSARRWLSFFSEHRDAAIVVLKEASSIDPRFEQGFVDLRKSAVTFFAARFKRLQELGLVRSQVSPELAAHLQLGMFDALLNDFVLRDGDVDLDALAESLADFEWNGIRAHRPFDVAQGRPEPVEGRKD
jgi:AcrR family transcriptional regulator